MVSHAVTLHDHGAVELGISDWADWDSNGDLLYAQGGRLFRRKLNDGSLLAAICLLDTSSFCFCEMATPDEARTWHLPLSLTTQLAS